jgi:hypothetical protein
MESRNEKKPHVALKKHRAAWAQPIAKSYGDATLYHATKIVNI